MKRRSARRLWLTATLGIAFIAIVGGAAVAGVASGFGVFSRDVTVTAEVPSAGPALQTGAEVEYRGVLVGSVRKIGHRNGHAVLTLGLNPSQTSSVPAAVTVRLVPRSVFGDLYVDLVPPSRIGTRPIVAGAVLPADTSAPTVQLNEALDAGYSVLTAIQPSHLNAALTALAQALNGNGRKLGQLIAQLDHYTGALAPHTDELIHDVATLGSVSAELSRDAPDLLRTLSDAIAVSHTVVQSQPALRKLLSSGPRVSDRSRQTLAENRQRLIEVTRLLAPVIGSLGAHQHDLRRGVRVLEKFLAISRGPLSQGPWLNAILKFDPSPADGKTYTANDCPRYPRAAGRNCPSGPAYHSPSAQQQQRIRERRAIVQVLLGPLLDGLGRAPR